MFAPETVKFVIGEIIWTKYPTMNETWLYLSLDGSTGQRKGSLQKIKNVSYNRTTPRPIIFL